MDENDTYPRLKAHLLSEVAFLVVVLSISIYMFVKSFEYGQTSQTFPQLTSGIVVLGCVLILLSDYLPEPMRQAVTESRSITGVESDEDAAMSSVEDEDAATSAVEDGDARSQTGDSHSNVFADRISDAEFTVVALVSYAVLSFLLSILIASPVFGVAYFLGTRKPWYLTLAMGVLGFGIPYLLMTVLYIPLDEGLLFGGI